MIKFFRKIRYNLMEQNKTGKYLKYAIGEILLVIIGILIALQVNNLNEKRKVDNEMKTKINALAVNLEDEIRVSGVQYHANNIKKIQKLIGQEINLNSPSAQQDYSNIINLRLRIKDDVLEETIDILIENEDRLPARYKKLVGPMKSLKFYFSNYKKTVAEFTALKRNNEKFLENNYTWYALNDSISNKERMNYYSTDPLFKNRLFTIQQKYRDAFSFYTYTIILKLQIIYAIKKEDENYAAKDFGAYLSNFTFIDGAKGFFKEGKKVSCKENFNTTDSVGSAHLLLNASSDTLRVTSRITNGKKRNTIIAPYNSLLIYSSSENDIISVYRNNTCQAYQVTEYNFMVIE